MSAVSTQFTTAPEIGAVVASLERCEIDALRLHWRNHLGSSAPAHLPRWLLMRILVYRLQVIACGDLSAETKRLLGITSGRRRPAKNNRVAALQDRDARSGALGCYGEHGLSDQAEQSDIVASNCSETGNGNISPKLPSSLQKQRRAFVKRAAVTRDGQQLYPGSILAREWDGAIQRVMVGENGQFIFNGKAYGSLSQIAKLITGTNWNGHRFFGLKKGHL